MKTRGWWWDTTLCGLCTLWGILVWSWPHMDPFSCDHPVWVDDGTSVPFHMMLRMGYVPFVLLFAFVLWLGRTRRFRTPALFVSTMGGVHLLGVVLYTPSMAIANRNACLAFLVIFGMMFLRAWTEEKYLEGRGVVKRPKGLVALVTGANAGIGLSLARRLCEDGVKVVIACRNKDRGEAAVKKIKRMTIREADIHLLIMDVSNPGSVIAGAREYRARFHTLDLLFLNAGIYPQSGYKWSVIYKCITDPLTFFETGGGFLVEPIGLTNDQGRGLQFATNLLGHFLLVQELEDLLILSSARILWTGSRAADPSKFSFEDPQCLHGSNPYPSSKFAVDLANLAMQERLKAKNVFSYTVCPGAVQTDIVPFFGRMMWPLLWLLQFLIPTLHMHADGGSDVLYHLSAEHPPPDPSVKYVMDEGVLHTISTPGVTPDKAQRMYDLLCQLVDEDHERLEDEFPKPKGTLRRRM